MATLRQTRSQPIASVTQRSRGSSCGARRVAESAASEVTVPVTLKARHIAGVGPGVEVGVEVDGGVMVEVVVEGEVVVVVVVVVVVDEGVGGGVRSQAARKVAHTISAGRIRPRGSFGAPGIRGGRGRASG